MIHRRHLPLVVALLAATALLTSSSGLSMMTADRSVSIEIAEDPNAYLGFEQTQSNNGNVTANVNVTQRNNGNDTANLTQSTNRDGTASVDVTVINQFPTGTELTTVEITANGTSVDLAPLAPGERATHTFPSVSCGNSIRIEASGDGVTVRLERAVDCT